MMMMIVDDYKHIHVNFIESAKASYFDVVVVYVRGTV